MELKSGRVMVKGRAASQGVTLAPWRKSGSHILVSPPGEAIAKLFGLVNWEARTLETLRRVTDRPLRVSRKPDPVPVEERLRDCHCVVTWTSNLAVDAIVAGVPAIVGPAAASIGVAGNYHQLEYCIENPPTPERECWVESLAWGQFNLEEIRSGFARAVVMEGLT